MGLQKELATLAMRATPLPGGGDNFMAAAKIPTPVPSLPGSIGAVAHEPFMARETRRSFDLVVVFTIGDFADSTGCSEYYNPHSPWYNVFYGAYGLRSYEPDGSAWGFHTDGTPNIPEMLQVPELDYNWLTAGALGCPPPRMCFRTEEVRRAGTAPGTCWTWRPPSPAGCITCATPCRRTCATTPSSACPAASSWPADARATSR